MSNGNPVKLNHENWFVTRRLTIVLAVLTLLVLVLSAPAGLRHAYENSGFYVFSRAFLEDIPKRLTGPGRFRFVLQPLIAIILGIRGGLSDAREGKPAFLYGVIFHRQLRRVLLKSGFRTVINLLLMGILMDAVFQWIILGVSHAGAALVVGPAVIVVPYAITRALANCVARLRTRPSVSVTCEKEAHDSLPKPKFQDLPTRHPASSFAPKGSQQIDRGMARSQTECQVELIPMTEINVHLY